MYLASALDATHLIGGEVEGITSLGRAGIGYRRNIIAQLNMKRAVQ